MKLRQKNARNLEIFHELRNRRFIFALYWSEFFRFGGEIGEKYQPPYPNKMKLTKIYQHNCAVINITIHS